MPKTLSASRVVAGDPAVVALLMTGPGAADFLPETLLTSVAPGQVTGVIQLGAEGERRVSVFTAAPRRTPTAYVASFQVQIDGMPLQFGALQVMSAGPAESRVDFSLTSDETIPDDLEVAFQVIVGGFFDSLERAADEQTPAA